mmetsp:Transcript_18843/g.34065  ORF Transcript_18843/g.34065 Transcript_18843/m.34065 type:complete len:80 (+) Transcript_18843:313-552(+)
MFLALAIKIPGVDLVEGEIGGEAKISPVGVAAVVCQGIVLALSLRPGIKIMRAYRAEEKRLRAAVDSEIAKQATTGVPT